LATRLGIKLVRSLTRPAAAAHPTISDVMGSACGTMGCLSGIPIVEKKKVKR